MIGKKLYKGKYTNQEYAECAIWCNSNNAHIEDKGTYYEIVLNTPYIPTIQDQIHILESTITNRLIRNAILGEEYAKNKLSETEDKISVLRSQIK